MVLKGQIPNDTGKLFSSQLCDIYVVILMYVFFQKCKNNVDVFRHLKEKKIIGQK